MSIQGRYYTIIQLTALSGLVFTEHEKSHSSVLGNPFITCEDLYLPLHLTSSTVTLPGLVANSLSTQLQSCQLRECAILSLFLLFCVFYFIT